ncbi:MAG: carboxypeptidase regulatory-like domain-containing protein [Acidobacteriia bacterium]|nr:carboxypeptidase regulatory-like domain-containing protein [Terriglobia bacterium]
MRTALLVLLTATAALGQNPAAQNQGSGRIEGVVADAMTHQPIKNASVALNSMTFGPGRPQPAGPRAAITDFSGKFTFDGLPAGSYQIIVNHQSYPTARFGGVRKTVQVSSETVSVTMELIPGGSISGRFLDEDGDPMVGCFAQIHTARNLNEGVPMMGMENNGEGSYRVYGIPPGKYSISARCSGAVFQQRPLSEGPDPVPTAAYPVQFYSGASDVKSAEVIELAPGEEKQGIDFHMRPAPVTQIHGIFAPGGADWRGHNDLQIQLVPVDGRDGAMPVFFSGAQIDRIKGTFEIRQVFPGSYRLIAFSQDFRSRGSQADAADRDTADRIGATERIDVADKPIEVSLQLRHSVDLSGTVEIENASTSRQPVPLNQIGIQLLAATPPGGPPNPTQVKDDGTFTIKSVLPGEWRLNVTGPFIFLKSAWAGGTEITNGHLDLTSGAAGPLRLLVSANTATIRGTASVGQMVMAQPIDDDGPFRGGMGSVADANGQFTFQGLAPGKYRITLRSPGEPEEGGEEVTVRDGETASVDLKASAKP